jgi:hypothetical protein
MPAADAVSPFFVLQTSGGAHGVTRPTERHLFAIGSFIARF